MDRERFRNQMNNGDAEFTYQERLKITRDIAKTQPLDTNIIWAMEEMGELQQALGKHLRGFSNHNDILQEIADVKIALEVLQQRDWGGRQLVTPHEVNKAVDVKLDRDQKRVVRP